MPDIPFNPPDKSQTAHRPWKIPAGRHAIEMVWHDLLFAHWPVPVHLLRPLIPPRLEIDLFEGQAWLGIVPFRMSGVRALPFPAVPGSALFPEINVRTYVIESGKPGVWFFSLDAASLLAVKAARAWYHLPYFHADISVHSEREWIAYESSRRNRSDSDAVGFEGKYRATGPPSCGQCGPLAHWLTERYCLYSVTSRHLYRAEIHHAMWPLQPAEAEISRNTMTRPLGINLPDVAPLLHFAEKLEVSAWRPQ